MTKGARCGLLGLLAALLYLTSAGWRIASRTPQELFAQFRSWDDLALATGFAARSQFPVAPYRVRDMVRRDGDPRFIAFRDGLHAALDRHHIRPSQFWRAMPTEELSPESEWRLGRRLDDVGRPLFLGAAFKLLSGAAPFLLFWLGVFATAPVLGWVVCEASRAGYAVAGMVFALAFACSAFVLDVSFTGYSPAAFHVVGLLVVVALGIYSGLGEPTPGGLLARAIAGGLLLGLCALARGTVLTFLPGAGLAASIGVLRAGRTRPIRGRALYAATLLAVLVVPYVGINARAQRLIQDTSRIYGHEEVPRYHDLSLLIWKGLGDFDRTKGYTFWDMAGQEAVRKASPSGAFDREGELQLRQAIIRDIFVDPLWFARILVERLVETVAMPKLWSYGPRDAASFRPAGSPNEGAIDSYYGLSRQADWIAFGPWERELPTVLLLLPALLLAVLGLVRQRSEHLGAVWRRASAGAVPALCLALAVLPVPIVITTATAFEPQCFVLVDFVFLAFLVDGLCAVSIGGVGPGPGG